MQADPRIYVALDLPSIDEARALVSHLGSSICAYKIGLQLLPIGGRELACELKAQGKQVFLDYKLHDIGATVEKAARSIAHIGADLLTVHATPDVMAAAVRGRGASDLKLLGVTVLTSLDDQALMDMGYFVNTRELVRRRVRQAVKAGMDGVVCSALEAAEIRPLVPKNFLVVTPGIRMKGGRQDDQKRVATPSFALKSGASHLVIGRPISQAENPKQAALGLLKSIRN